MSQEEEGSKNNPKKPLTEKEKGDKSLKGVGNGDESIKKSAEKEMVAESLPGKVEKFQMTAIDVYLTLDVPIVENKFLKSISLPSTKNIKRITILSSLLKYVKDMSQITSQDWCQFILEKLISNVRHYKERKAAKVVHFDGPLFFVIASSPIQQVMDQAKQELKKASSISSFTLVLGVSQPDTQSPVPTSRSVPDQNIVRETDNDKDDDDDAPLRFPLRQTSSVNCDLSIKEPPENKSKAGEKSAHKKGEGICKEKGRPPPKLEEGFNPLNSKGDAIKFRLKETT
ncbi:hypothetical protein Cgig2_011962 [Carnegiea gigantea]|uniref:Uncharacterized protein n=1 Tax=Carnegiea gigantea TaxID=171969 RepID=A0A9Q1JMN3_9CARY|nr:hypothetical protein Cgig2_011962 [Carnegiea gigantea]